MKTCDELKIKFAPSLIDFHWSHQGIVAGANVVKGGRSDIVRDPARGRIFFDEVLDPLLDISLRYHETIYAWELINEPEWVSEPRLRPARLNENKTVTRDQMRAFIAEGAGRINAKRLPDGRRAFQSTVGFAHWDAIKAWDSAGLGLTLHQFHYYAPDRRRIPKLAFFGESQLFIGEFATTCHRGWPELKRRDMPQTISARLKLIEEKGYPAAFLWSARATDEATTWEDADQLDTIGYIRASKIGGSDGIG